MRFELRHRFSCDPETLWALIEEPEFDSRLAQASTSTREVVERRQQGDELFVKRRITARRTLPLPMQKVIGGEHLGWDQETRRKVGGEVLRWKIIPMVIRDRFTGEGTTIVRAVPGGCERVIAGDLTIKVPLLGAQMEKKLVEDVSASYEQAARIATQMLAERNAK